MPFSLCPNLPRCLVGEDNIPQDIYIGIGLSENGHALSLVFCLRSRLPARLLPAITLVVLGLLCGKGAGVREGRSASQFFDLHIAMLAALSDKLNKFIFLRC